MNKHVIFAAILLSMLICGSLRAELKELNSYVLCSDDFITRPIKAADAIFYGSDLKLITAKLKEYGLNFPDNMHFPQGGLFVIAVTDNTKESFQSASLDADKRLLVLDLAADKDASPPKSAAEKKTSRVLVIGCQPVKGLQRCAVKTADGVIHSVESKEVK